MNCLLQGTQLEDILEDDIFYQCITVFPKRSFKLSQLTESQLQEISNTIQNYLQCGLCKKMVKQSVYFICSHRFCRLCIQTRKVFDEINNGCPTCENTQEINSSFHYQQWMDLFIARGVNYSESFLKRENDQNPSFSETINKRLKLNNGRTFEIKEQSMIGDKISQIIKTNREQESNGTNYDNLKQQIIKSNVEEQANVNQIVKMQQSISFQSIKNIKSGSQSRNVSDKSVIQSRQFVKSESGLSFTMTDNISSFSKEQIGTQRMKQYKYQILSSSSNTEIIKQQQLDFESLNKKFDQNMIKEGLKYFKLKIKKHPADLLSPQIDISQILVNSNQCFDTLYYLISDLLNINKKYVQLYYLNENSIIRVNKNGMKQIKIKTILATQLPISKGKKNKDQFRKAITQFYDKCIKQSHAFIDRKSAAIVFYKIRMSKISIE